MNKTNKITCQIKSELNLLLLKCNNFKDLSCKCLSKGHDKRLRFTRESLDNDQESLSTL